MCDQRRPAEDQCMKNSRNTPGEAVSAAADNPVLPTGDDERFVGFGVMGLPFTSGHYLALRSFPAASFAPAYDSVWHRDPDGTWTFYATTPGPQSCARYFSEATPIAPVECDIEVTWPTPWTVHISIAGLLDWTVEMAATPATRLMSAIGRRLPESAWTNQEVLALIGQFAKVALGAGDLRLAGVAPNGQHFKVGPRQVWAVAGSRARLNGHDLGPVGPLDRQACLGDFRLPQRGLGVLAGGHFENYDAARHRNGDPLAGLH